MPSLRRSAIAVLLGAVLLGVVVLGGIPAASNRYSTQGHRSTSRLAASIVVPTTSGNVSAPSALAPQTPQPTAPVPSTDDQDSAATTGPYVSLVPLEVGALQGFHCPVPDNLRNAPSKPIFGPGEPAGVQTIILNTSTAVGICQRISAKFFPTTDQATQGGAAPVLLPSQNPSSATYEITIHGNFPFPGLYKGNVPPPIDHWNYLFNASTGSLIGGGTAGTPLP